MEHILLACAAPKAEDSHCATLCHFGRRIELRLLDDRSEASASARLYEQLIEGREDVLLGPFGSAATLAASAVSEHRRRVLVNATGITRGTQRAGTRYVFQVPAPAAEYGTGAHAVAQAAGYRRLHVVSRNDPASREAAGQCVEKATASGMDAPAAEAAPASQVPVQIAKARSRDAQAWIAFGQPEDAADMIIAFKKIGYAPWMFVAQGVAEPRFLSLVGRDAEHALGLSPYETRLPTRGNAEFVEAWRKRWPDDVIATLARQAVARGLRVVVVSLDKDLLQLVGDSVVVLNPGREGSGATLYDAKAVEAKFGVPPERVVDVLALVGDAVDNVPGVPGIGDKGARDLVREYGSSRTRP